MADPISVVAQATTGTSWVDTPVLRSVPESDSARLTDILSTQRIQDQAPSAISPVAQAAQAAANGNTMGDAIIRSLEATGRSYASKSEGIRKMLSVDAPHLSPRDLLRVQFELIDTSMQVDLLAKVVGKGTQFLDQMTKLQ
jgi:type III secretion system YscI/HrpB-like protein